VPAILVDENDVDGLADAILKVRQSESMRERLGVQNREIAERFFSTRNADRTLNILHDLAGKKQ